MAGDTKKDQKPAGGKKEQLLSYRAVGTGGCKNAVRTGGWMEWGSTVETGG